MPFSWTETSDFTPDSSVKTRAGLRAEVRTRINEPTEAFILDTEINQWIQDGANDFAARTNCITAIATGDTTSGTREYVMPTNCIKILRLWYNDGSNWYPVSYVDLRTYEENLLNSDTASSTPEVFYVSPQRLIGLVPKPSYSGTANLKIFFSKYQPTISSDSTQILIRTEYQEAIIDYCVYQCYRKSKNWKDADYIFGEYNKKLQEAKREMINETKNRYNCVKDESETQVSGGAGFYHL